MPISMYEASVPVFAHYLGNLSEILARTAAHADARKIDPLVFMQARLAPDMLPLVRQVQIAADFAKGASARLAGVDVPRYADDEKTCEEARGRIGKTLAFIKSLPASAFEDAADRTVTLTSGDKTTSHAGRAYLLYVALPQFFFHVTACYAILRHNGIELSKRDYLGATPD